MLPTEKAACMSEHHDPFPTATAEIAAAIYRTAHYRRQRRSRGRFRRGRLWLILIFLGLRAGDALMYFGSPAIDRPRVLASIVIGGIWTTSALGGLWAMQAWCRYALNILIVLTTIASTCFISAVFQLPVNQRVLIFLFAAAMVNGAAIWAVISSPGIRRLTSRSYK
jgi:hypothetical protein